MQLRFTPPIDDTPWRLDITDHARARMAEMDVTEADVQAVLEDPKGHYAGNNAGNRDARVYLGRGDVDHLSISAIRTAPRTYTVCTVLWQTMETYQRPA